MKDIVIIILIVAITLIITYYQKQKRTETNETSKDDGIYPYERTYLLTKNEWSFHKKLKPIADKMGYTILAKIRLADLIKVKTGTPQKDYNKYFSKIRSKHIDFILCNPENLAPILLIELDDPSHKREDRKNRDKFVDNALNTAGYKILHTTGGAELENQINTILEK